MKEIEDDLFETDEKGIDIFSLLLLLWKKRILVLKVTACFMAIGLFLALFSPEKYTSECVFVPQMSQGLSSKYSSLASVIGIDMSLASSGTDGQVNPRLYPLILDNPQYLKDLINTKIHVEKASEPVSIYDYYISGDYRKFNLVSFVAKYTIGLPRTVVGWFRKDKEVVTFSDSDILPSENGIQIKPVIRFTKQEFDAARIVRKSMKMEVDIKKGYLTLTVNMPEAQASTEVCQAAYQLLQHYIREYKKQKSEVNLAFISSELSESRKGYENAQSQLAAFMDSNNDIDRATAKVRKIRLESDYELAGQMYFELSKQELSAKVKVNEETVSFTELVPPSVPLKRTSPKRAQMLTIWTILGLISGCIFVVGKEKYLAWKNN